METRLQNLISGGCMQSNSAAISVNLSVPFDSTANGRDWQEEVYQKIKTMTDLYLLDLMPTQGGSGAFGDPTMESGDWRAQVLAESRQRMVHKIMDTLKRHPPFNGDEGLQELKKIAVRFEERMYVDATSQSDYLRKISSKMLTMETRSQNSDAYSVNPQIHVFHKSLSFIVMPLIFINMIFVGIIKKYSGSNICTFILYDILGKLLSFVIIV